jgi:hypothetical protein
MNILTLAFKFILICVAMMMLGGINAIGMFTYMFSDMMHVIMNGLG